MSIFTTARDKSQWQWDMMILAPDWIESDMFQMAVVQAGEKNPPARSNR